jgi:predicted nucleic acid-binding protein
VSGWLLDSNVVSELRKPKPDSKVINFIAAQPGETLFVTDITLAEITYGIEQLGGAAR